MRNYDLNDVMKSDKFRATERAILTDTIHEIYPLVPMEVIIDPMELRDRLIMSDLLKKQGITYINEETFNYVFQCDNKVRRCIEEGTDPVTVLKDYIRQLTNVVDEF